MTGKPGRQVVGLLLAAGFSRRFGADKLTQPLPDDGEWVAARACRNLLAGSNRVTAVVRPENTALIAEFRRLGADIAFCENASTGMGASIAAGIAANAGAKGWLIALADMPWISPDTIRAVTAALNAGAALAAPRYRGRRGHPVGFAARLGHLASKLEGDQGGRELLLAHASELELLDVNDPGVLLDIDRPGDLRTPRS